MDTSFGALNSTEDQADVVGLRPELFSLQHSGCLLPVCPQLSDSEDVIVLSPIGSLGF